MILEILGRLVFDNDIAFCVVVKLVLRRPAPTNCRQAVGFPLISLYSHLSQRAGISLNVQPPVPRHTLLWK